MRRSLGRLVVTIALAVAALGVEATSPLPAAALSCGGSITNPFWGQTETHTDAVRGGKVAIEYFNPALCTTPGATSFSTYWVGIVGRPTTLGYNIYQVGVLKCQGSCGAVQSNQTVKVWAFGSDPGQCGAAIAPVPNPVGNISSGTLTYKIIRENKYGVWYYNLYISTTAVQEWTYSDVYLETCWGGGVDEVEYWNETGLTGDQVGGQPGNTQTFQSAYWYDGSAWHSVTGTLGATCDQDAGLSYVGCKWHSTDNTVWNVWDSRY